jgi:hypothetical protein
MKSTKNMMKPVLHSYNMMQLLKEYHDGPVDEKQFDVNIQCSSSLDPRLETFEVGQNVTVGDITNNFQVKCVRFKCCLKPEYAEQQAITTVIQHCGKEATKTAVNAFELMMAGGRQLVQKRQQGRLNKKENKLPQ